MYVYTSFFLFHYFYCLLCFSYGLEPVTEINIELISHSLKLMSAVILLSCVKMSTTKTPAIANGRASVK